MPLHLDRFLAKRHAFSSVEADDMEKVLPLVIRAAMSVAPAAARMGGRLMAGAAKSRMARVPKAPRAPKLRLKKPSARQASLALGGAAMAADGYTVASTGYNAVSKGDGMLLEAVLEKRWKSLSMAVAQARRLAAKAQTKIGLGPDLLSSAAAAITGKAPRGARAQVTAIGRRNAVERVASIGRIPLLPAKIGRTRSTKGLATKPKGWT